MLLKLMKTNLIGMRAGPKKSNVLFLFLVTFTFLLAIPVVSAAKYRLADLQSSASVASGELRSLLDNMDVQTRANAMYYLESAYVGLKNRYGVSEKTYLNELGFTDEQVRLIIVGTLSTLISTALKANSDLALASSQLSDDDGRLWRAARSTMLTRAATGLTETPTPVIATSIPDQLNSTVTQQDLGNTSTAIALSCDPCGIP